MEDKIRVDPSMNVCCISLIKTWIATCDSWEIWSNKRHNLNRRVVCQMSLLL